MARMGADEIAGTTVSKQPISASEVLNQEAVYTGWEPEAKTDTPV